MPNIVVLLLPPHPDGNNCAAEAPTVPLLNIVRLYCSLDPSILHFVASASWIEAVNPFYTRKIRSWVRYCLRTKQPKVEITVYDRPTNVQPMAMVDESATRDEVVKQAAVAAVGR